MTCRLTKRLKLAVHRKGERSDQGMNWYLEALKKYAAFSGRARRKEFWTFLLLNGIIAVALILIEERFTGIDPASDLSVLAFLFSLAVLLPSLAVGVRRLHDTGRVGSWLFIAYVPIIGTIVLLAFLLEDGHAGDNQYGPNPKVSEVLTPTQPVSPELLQHALRLLTRLVRTEAPSEFPAAARRYISIPDGDLDREVRWLALSASHLVLYDVLKDHDPLLRGAQGELVSQVAGKDATVARERLRHYGAAMSVRISNESMFELPDGAAGLPFNGTLSHDVGLLFAFVVGAHLNPVVTAAGAMIFSVTCNTVREALSDGLSLSRTPPQPHQVEPPKATEPAVTRRLVTCAQCGAKLRLEKRSFGSVLHCPDCGAVRKAQASALLLRHSDISSHEDGSSPDRAIVVGSVIEEYAWVAQNCPGLTVELQAVILLRERPLDMLTLRSEAGETRDVYFDVSAFL